MKKTVIVFLFVLFFILPNEGFSQEPQYLWDYQFDVPYVPTPFEVVNEMLKMANVGKNDVLYDLGCGNGSFLLTYQELGSGHRRQDRKKTSTRSRGKRDPSTVNPIEGSDKLR